MCVFNLKMFVYVTSEGEKNDYFRNLFRVISQNLKHIFSVFSINTEIIA